MPRKRRTSRATIAGTLAVLGILFLILLVRTITAEEQPAWTPAPPAAAATPGALPEAIEVFFTDPSSPAASSLRGGPDEPLAAALAAARLSIDLAAYEFNLASLRAALLDAHRRGVTVRMVTESDNLDGEEIHELSEAGIEILGDRREGLMHNKFVVIDRQEVWTGSMNLTRTDAYRNNNNYVRFRSTGLAENYTAEFEEMFVDDQFGPGSPADTPRPWLEVGGVPLEVYFSPDDGVAARLVELIGAADESIDFLAFSFTSDPLGEAVLERAQAGVGVRGVMEAAQVESNTGGEYARFRRAGLDVRLDGNPRNLHHKVFILDGKTVVMGSYNFSRSAEERNDENLLVIHSPEIAAQYLAEFEQVYAAAQTE